MFRCLRRSSAFALISVLTLLLFLTGCNSQSAPVTPANAPQPTSKVSTPPRPTVPPPPFKVFHQTTDTFTLVTKDTATDDEIEAILWQLRDAAHAHAFDSLKIDQKVIDARKPIIWFHLYRGAKCATEKYAPGKTPCGDSYHAAGDYTFGDYTNHEWDKGVLQQGGKEVLLWDPDAQRGTGPGKP